MGEGEWEGWGAVTGTGPYTRVTILAVGTGAWR